MIFFYSFEGSSVLFQLRRQETAASFSTVHQLPAPPPVPHDGYQILSTSNIPLHCTTLPWGFTGGIKLRHTGLTGMWVDKWD